MSRVRDDGSSVSGQPLGEGRTADAGPEESSAGAVTDTQYLVKLLYGTHSTAPSVVVECHDWVHATQANELLVAETHDGGYEVRWRGGGLRREPLRTMRRIWFVPPDRLRVEIVRDGRVVRAGVRNGPRWWRWDENEGESAGDPGRDGAVIPQLLEPQLLWPERLLTSVWLEPNGFGVRAGRRALHALGVPRRRFDERREVSFEFEFDVEHGTPLRRTAFECGVKVTETEVVAISYGNEVSGERFIAAAPSGTDDSGRSGDRRRSKSRRRPDAVTSSVTVPRVATAKTLWLTGLVGAGKTTIALAVERLLMQLGYPCCVLDGDALRIGLSGDLELSREGRREEVRRVAHVAVLLATSGVFPIVALASPDAEDRARARSIHAALGVPFLEIWVDTPLDVCVRRGPKGLDADARSHRLVGTIAVDASYEVPVTANVRVAGFGEHPRYAAVTIVDEVLKR